MGADRESWPNEPFTGGSLLPFSSSLTPEEFERVRDGLVPVVMEDKWFVYYEAPFLLFHRSWTGEAVYRLRLGERDGGGATVEEALVSDRLAGADEGALAYEAALLGFLIANLLLGKDEPFPAPLGVRRGARAVLQHHVSGTGYPARRVGRKKPWWRPW